VTLYNVTFFTPTWEPEISKRERLSSEQQWIPADATPLVLVQTSLWAQKPDYNGFQVQDNLANVS
jgi:hypothetical protein